MAAAFAIPILLEVVTLSVLALTGGAHQGDTSSVGPIFLTAGFALFAVISVYVG